MRTDAFSVRRRRRPLFEETLMRPCNLRGRLTPRTGLVIALALIAGLAACATDVSRVSPPSGSGEYVGVFTGEFVDGKPLYRLPTIEVVGSRRSASSAL